MIWDGAIWDNKKIEETWSEHEKLVLATLAKVNSLDCLYLMYM